MKKILVIISISLIAVGLWRFSSGPVPAPEQKVPEIKVSSPVVEDASKKIIMPALANPTQKYSAETTRKLKILDEVFASKNDNDPRLDSEFKDLTPEMREALVTSYKAAPKELLNERGTLIFLLGRKIDSEKDLEFFHDLMSEAPCLSMSDCSAETKPTSAEDDHSAESQSTTLVYPQLVALRLVSASYQKSKNAELKERIQEFFKNAQTSKSEYISDEAERIAKEAGI